MKKVSYLVAILFIIVGLDLILVDGDIGSGLVGIILGGLVLSIPKEKFEEWKDKKQEKQLRIKKRDLDEIQAIQKKTVNYKKMAVCPNCGNTDIRFLGNNKKGFSVGKAIGGAALTGGIGTLAGFAGKKGKKNSWHCSQCGNLFKLKSRI